MRLIDQLPDNYKKTRDSNNFKLLELAQQSLDDIKKVFEDIESIRDIDKAFGVNLDRAGKNVLEYRGGREEETFRKFIKIKIRAMRSSGDIPTLNELFNAILGDDYLGITESWNDDDFYDEPAAMIGDIKSTSSEYLGIFDDYLVAGGVKLIWRMLLADTIMQILSYVKTGFWKFPLCNTIEAGNWPYLLNDGKLTSSYVKIISEELSKEFSFKETATIKTSNYFYADHMLAKQKTIISNIIETVQSKTVDIELLKSGEKLSGIHPYTINEGKLVDEIMSIQSDLSIGYAKYSEAGLLVSSEEVRLLYDFAKQKTIRSLLESGIYAKGQEIDYKHVNEILTGKYPELIKEMKILNEETGLTEEVRSERVSYPLCNQINTKE